MVTLLWALTSVLPGEIFGDVKSGESYLGNTTITLTCGTETVTATTDSAGSFRLRTKATGKCRLGIAWKEQSPAVDVVVFERPTRYRLLVEEKDGKFILKRV